MLLRNMRQGSLVSRNQASKSITKLVDCSFHPREAIFFFFLVKLMTSYSVLSYISIFGSQNFEDGLLVAEMKPPSAFLEENFTIHVLSEPNKIAEILFFLGRRFLLFLDVYFFAGGQSKWMALGVSTSFAIPDYMRR